MGDGVLSDIRPMLCASLMVVPKSAHASRNLPLFVRYGPIMTRVSTMSNVGRLQYEASLRHCIDAATAKGQQPVSKRNRCSLTEGIARLALHLHRSSMPRVPILVIDTVLNTLRKYCE